jgi:serine/threonine protein kinase
LSSTPSTRFGKYELLDRIAAGGMAEIFRARYEPAPGVMKSVVIKKILPHYAENKGFIGMFTNEARIVMGLSHGNIAQVFDFGAIDGDYFLAMEFVDGHPLSKVVKRARTLGMPVLPPEYSAFIVAEVLKGLHYAHTRLDESGRPLRIVHRDVSPQNVLLSYEGQVKLVDFGIAKARNASSEETAANAVKGKYAYFAPEQAKAKELDARTDVFATGIVLYELLTGQLPFQGRLMDVLARIVRGQFQKPRELNPRIPPELERIVLKAMALEKADRYQTAEAFQQDLVRFLGNNHPEFTSGMVTQLLQLLFEEELVAEGRPVQLPREFMERAQKWKEPLPAAQPGKADENEVPTEMVAFSDPKPAFPRLGDAPPPKKKRGFPWAGALGLLVAASAVGFGGVSLWQSMQQATIEVVSVPAGAEVVIDGKALPSRTPVKLGGLAGDRTLRVEVLSPGHEPWKNEVPLKRGQHLVVEAKLQRLPPPAPPKAPEPPPPPPKAPEPPPAPDLVTWPVTRFELDAARHRLDLTAAGAAVVPLEPAKTYRVSLPGKMLTPGWGFYVVSEGGAQPGSFGVEALQIKSASKLYAFHVPASVLGAPGKDETKARTLQVQVAGQRKVSTKGVPAKLGFSSAQRVTVTGLSVTSIYELTPRQGSPPAVLRERGQPVTRVVVGTPEGLVIAPIDEATRLEGLSQFWVTLLDDVADAQGGRLAFELREVPKKKKR